MKYAVWKKAAVFLLAACMVLAFGGTAAFAEGETGNVAQVNGTQYATLDEVWRRHRIWLHRASPLK